MSDRIHPYPVTPYNFLGIDDVKFEKAGVVVLPVPFDSTTSYKGGTKEGPDAVIRASRELEVYDTELDCVISDKVHIFTARGVQPDKSSPEKTVNRVKEATQVIVDAGKFPLVLGGEHSISSGAIAAVKEKYPDVTILQIDAHSDLRESWDDAKYSHASVMKRVRDMGIKTVHVGIRATGPEELDYIKKEKVPIFKAPFSIKDIPKIIKALGDQVYITFDVDGLDPSIMPATGTPVPGGLKWEEATALLKEVAKKKTVVGADVVELSPQPGNHAPDFLTATLVHKIIGYVFCQKNG